MRLSEKDKEKILKEYPRKRTYALAREIGCSFKTVYTLLLKHNRIHNPKVVWTKERTAELMRLYRTMPTEELAKQMGCTVRALYAHIHNIKIRTNKKDYGKSIR